VRRSPGKMHVEPHRRHVIPPFLEGKNARPLWSVMIPTYNPSEEFLEHALHSVLEQDPGAEQMQIEVVDDCSSQVEVARLVERIGGGRVSVFRNPFNRGLAGCWNACIERAPGEWVHILHQDDKVSSGFYRVMKELIEAHPSAGAAFCHYGFIDSEGQPWADEPALQTTAGELDAALETLAIRNQVQCPGIVVRRSVYERVGGYSDQLIFTLDWEMWVRIAAEYPILYHPDVMASFRVQGGSETSRLARNGDTVRDSMKAIEAFAAYLPASRVQSITQQARRWVCDVAMQKAHRFLRDGDLAGAMAQIQAALRYDRRASFWVNSLRCWMGAMIRSGAFITPPFPLVPFRVLQSTARGSRKLNQESGAVGAKGGKKTLPIAEQV
jgi:glycosyltransferase involved in cell wall biosynthesis